MRSIWFPSAVSVCAVLGGMHPAMAQSARYTVFGDKAGDRLGRAVGPAGDIDGDGKFDFIAGAYQGDTLAVDGGYARVYSGKTGATLFTVAGDQTNEQAGISVAGGGDLDGDGIPDVLVGSYGRDSGNLTDVGCVRVVSGATGNLIAMFLGTQNNAHFGYGVASVGDANLDGRVDFAIGSPFEDCTPGPDGGTVTLVSGLNGSVLQRYSGVTAFEEFGRVLAGGDYNNDGAADVAVGSWHADYQGIDSGACYVFSGLAGGPLLGLVTGHVAGDFFGISVDLAHDIDGDGADDFIVGSHHDDPNGTQSGSARVFSGATSALLYEFDGEVPDMYFGRSVAGLGDVDGDGVPDVEAGTPFLGNATGFNHGLARVYSGKTGALLYQLNEDSVNDIFAFAVAGIGDSDGNGYDDILIGARDDDDTGSNAGSARVYNGCAGSIVLAGTGFPGSGGLVPSLVATGCPREGATITLTAANALGGASGLLLLAPQLGSTPITAGGVFLSLQVPLLVIVPAALSGSGAGNGGFGVTTTIPAGFAQATIAMQLMVADPGAFVGFSLSNAVRITIG